MVFAISQIAIHERQQTRMRKPTQSHELILKFCNIWICTILRQTHCKAQLVPDVTSEVWDCVHCTKFNLIEKPSNFAETEDSVRAFGVCGNRCLEHLSKCRCSFYHNFVKMDRLSEKAYEALSKCNHLANGIKPLEKSATQIQPAKNQFSKIKSAVLNRRALLSVK